MAFADPAPQSSAVAASAGPSVRPTAQVMAPLDVTRPVSLTIHRQYLPDAPEGAYNVPHVGVSGAKFTVYQVFTDAGHTAPIDLASAAGFQSARQLIQASSLTPTSGTVSVGDTTFYLSLVATLTTGIDGSAAMSADRAGVYLVVENLDEAETLRDVTTGAVLDKSIFVQTPPFVVTLPTQGPDGWMYDVVVWPKGTQRPPLTPPITPTPNPVPLPSFPEEPEPHPSTPSVVTPTPTAPPLIPWWREGPKLPPKTGVAGRAITLGGIALVLGGAGLLLVRRRRPNESRSNS